MTSDITPASVLETAEWLRQKEKAGFIILSIVKITNDAGTTANLVEFRPKEFQETPDLPQLLALKTIEETDQRAEIAAILKQGNRPIVRSVIAVKDGNDLHEVDVFLYRPDTGGAWANSLVPATVGALALNIPWAEGKWSALDFKGLQEKKLLSFDNGDEPDVVAAVTDADIDTDGPGGSKAKDRYWSPNTSLRHPGGASCDSREFRGVVTPPALRQKYGIAIGDLAWVILGGKQFGAQVYDSGPEDKIGEISFGLAVDLGIYPNREPATEARAATRGNDVKDLVTVFFPGTGHGKAMEPQDIEASAQACMRHWLGTSMPPEEKALFTNAATGSATWEAFIASLRLPPLFEPADLLVKTSKSPNTPPPQALWHNIAPTLAVLVEIQKKFQKRLVFHSTYRSPLYNNGVGGAPRSQHLAFRAVDFSVPGVSPETVADFAKTLRKTTLTSPLPNLTLSNNIPGVAKAPPLDLAALKIQPNPAGGTNFEFHGGIQDYATFVHVDCRGIDAEWG